MIHIQGTEVCSTFILLTHKCVFFCIIFFRYTELKQTNQKLEDSIKSKDSRFEELEYMYIVLLNLSIMDACLSSVYLVMLSNLC